jgi:hypothetical protein
MARRAEKFEPATRCLRWFGAGLRQLQRKRRPGGVALAARLVRGSSSVGRVQLGLRKLPSVLMAGRVSAHRGKRFMDGDGDFTAGAEGHKKSDLMDATLLYRGA